MLKQRVLTAVVLVAVLLGVMLGLPPIATVWLLTVLVLIGAWEWAGFLGDSRAPSARAAFTDRRWRWRWSRSLYLLRHDPRASCGSR